MGKGKRGRGKKKVKVVIAKDMNAEEKVDKAEDTKNVEDKVKEERLAKEEDMNADQEKVDKAKDMKNVEEERLAMAIEAEQLIMEAALLDGAAAFSPMQKRLRKLLAKKNATKSASGDPKPAEPAQHGMPNPSAFSSGLLPDKGKGKLQW